MGVEVTTPRTRRSKRRARSPLGNTEVASGRPTPISSLRNQIKGASNVGTVTTKDGTEIYYKDWGSGRPIVFSHGWPLSADAFEDQMFFLAQHGYRCIAADRRGHGRSSQPWQGNDLDTYADDLAEVVKKLDLKGAIHVGHSTGGGEVAPATSAATAPVVSPRPCLSAQFRQSC
jgi:non-heme chloroperoxidase